MTKLERIGSAALAVERFLTRAAVALGSMLLVLAVAVGFYQVLARFVLFRPASWSEPLIQATLIWMAYLALAGAMRAGTLISVDIMLRTTRGAAHRAIRVAGTVSIFALLAILVWYGIELCWRVRFQNVAGLNIPASYAYAALPIGSAISIVALIGNLVDPPIADVDTPDSAR
ncbi:TRAP transporter small permease [Tropicimonas marinistellae]|uniref:TRAP transporter small permease n=1 Tax=Tropicimonas marinistellae TaxID=1739787 RepID=UPI00082EE638|nr:TRAP transporter small permease subunit [Tropicimonas marinistellae]